MTKWFLIGDIVQIINDQHPMEGCLIIISKVKDKVSHGYMWLPDGNIALVKNIPNTQAIKVGKTIVSMTTEDIDRELIKGRPIFGASHEDTD